MDRRSFVSRLILGALGLGSFSASGCRNRPFAHLMQPGQKDMVGSTSAGAATYKPLIEGAVSRLLGRHASGIQTVGGTPGQPLRICFIGVENASAEEIGDFKEQIYEHIDTHIEQSNAYQPVSKRFIDAAMRETRLRPDELFLPKNMRKFTAALEQKGQPIDYLLYAKITSGTTRDGKDAQRDYMLTLEMVYVKNAQYDKEPATLSKIYHR